MSLHSHFDSTKWEGSETHVLPFCNQAEMPRQERPPESTHAGYYLEASQVQRGMLLAQREMLLDEIKRTQRQQTQLQSVLAEYEARLARIGPEIEAFERQSSIQSTAEEESSESLFTLLRGAH